MNIPLVLDYRDAWANNHFMDDLFEWQKRIHTRMESTCLKNSDQVIVLDNNMKELTKTAHPEIALNIKVIPHGFDPEDFKGTVKPTLQYKSGKLNLLYSGLFYESNQPDILLKAMKELGQESKIRIEDIHFHFQGGLSPRIKELVNDLKLGNSVTDYGYVTHSIAVANVKKADVLWMISNFSPAHKQVKSGKLFEYIGSGKPILGLVHSGSEFEGLKKYGAGYIAKPNDIETIKNSILSLIHDWRQNKLKAANKSYTQQFDRRKLTEELAKVFNTLSSQ
ncbi:MAG: glycosyltransferase [Gracilimonas sp.]|nr:glycosyltransferase [Gracilimonas sp.]